MTKAFVTGAAGFIGSTLAERLLEQGDEVIGWDDFSTGQAEFLKAAGQKKNFKMVKGDTLDLPALTQAMAGAEVVFHLAANADVRFGLEHPAKDVRQNTLATFNVLEAMRANGVKKIAFASTGSVYGEATVIPTPEDAPFPIQTSLYAASKLAGEALISAYGEGFAFEAYIFRFVSILGERYSHGHVLDFYKQLLAHPDYLRVLGNGTQKKSYLYVGDCIDAMLHVMRMEAARTAPHRVDVYNLGTKEYCQVNDSIKWICEHLGLSPRLEYSGGDRGWIGDNPFIFLDTGKIEATGWKAKMSIRESILRTLRWLEANRWILERK